MNQLEQAKIKLEEATRLVREAVDLSLEVMSDNAKPNPAVSSLWEDFLGSFLSYVKLKSKESKRNLFNAISFTKIWKI